MRSASASPGCFVLSPRKNRPRQQRNPNNPKPSDPLSESIRGPMAIILKSPVATGAPGIPPRWTRSAKDAVCTAYSSASHLWFTTSIGVVNEIYFPTIDQPQVRDLQFLITDGETFFHEERRNLNSTTEYLDATGLVACHHLVTRDAVEDGVHNGPLRCRFPPAPLGLLLGQADDLGDAQVAVQLAVHDEHAAPDDVPGLGNTFDCAATQAEVHGRLTFAGGAAITADQVRGRHGAGNQEDPDIVIHAIGFVTIAPADVVQGVLRRKAQFAPQAIGHQAIQTGALIDFVEVRHRFTGKQHAAWSGGLDRWPVHIVQEAFCQVAGWSQVPQTLLVLNADSGAAEIVRELDGGDIHLALLQIGR